LGVATRLAHLLPEQWHWLAKAGVPWLVAAFAVGAAARSLRGGAVEGAVCLVVATVAYYAFGPVLLGHPNHTPLGLWWLLVAVPGGGAFGALGALWRRGSWPLLAPAILSASLAAEAALFWFFRSDGPIAAPVLVAVAAAIPVALVAGPRMRPRAAALAGVLTVVAFVAEVAVVRATGYLA
jgi:hypothetical protein